jgi:hypothetical protein
MKTQESSCFSLKTLIPFLLISFGIAWGILALYIFAGAWAERVFGGLTGSHPLFYLAVYAPAVAACVVVVKHAGLAGLRGFLSRLLLWRCPWRWVLFLVLAVPLPFILAATVKGNLPTMLEPLRSPGVLLGTMFMMAIKGPVEEIGWRGFMLPLLQRRMAPLWAAIVLGIVWGLWHYPAFLLSGTPQSSWSFAAFFAGTVALSVLVTALFNHSGGSILFAALFHFQVINPVWPDAQPLDTVFFMALALVVTVCNRRSMLSRKQAATEVIPADGKGRNQ